MIVCGQYIFFPLECIWYFLSVLVSSGMLSPVHSFDLSDIRALFVKRPHVPQFYYAL
jgi:hypothetical protein